MGTKQIHVSGELWQEICTVGWRGTFECIEGLPEGATFCGVSYIFPALPLGQMGTPPPPLAEYMNFSRHTIALIFEYPDWPEIEPGKDAPIIRVDWEKIGDDAVEKRGHKDNV